MSNYIWSLEKGGRYIEELEFLIFPQLWCDESNCYEYPQIKDQSVHFKPILLYNCNLNMFWSAAKKNTIVAVYDN